LYISLLAEKKVDTLILSPMPGRGEAWLNRDIRAKHTKEILMKPPNIGMIRLFDLTTREV